MLLASIHSQRDFLCALDNKWPGGSINVLTSQHLRAKFSLQHGMNSIYPPRNQPWHIPTYTYTIRLCSKYNFMSQFSSWTVLDIQTPASDVQKFTPSQSCIKAKKSDLPSLTALRETSGKLTNASLGEEKS